MKDYQRKTTNENYQWKTTSERHRKWVRLLLNKQKQKKTTSEKHRKWAELLLKKITTNERHRKWARLLLKKRLPVKRTTSEKDYQSISSDRSLSERLVISRARLQGISKERAHRRVKFPPPVTATYRPLRLPPGDLSCQHLPRKNVVTKISLVCTRNTETWCVFFSLFFFWVSLYRLQR